ncbi:MAG TPA: D-aminoacyl-tRNA deacylase [Bryobacteraceae bacterium]|nr:D-aminoacyl-tRNA deacylase [Bryobacteraceae bacterium]
MIFLLALDSPKTLYHGGNQVTELQRREFNVRFLIQRVTRASVHVEGQLQAAIGSGLLVLIGISASDGTQEADYLAEKLVHLRIFPDEEGRMNRSAIDISGQLLLVSQFTLYGDCRKGRRPSFDAAAPPAAARALYEYVVAKVREKGLVTRTGVFQAHMQVELINDGPVTLMLDSEPAAENAKRGVRQTMTPPSIG